MAKAASWLIPDVEARKRGEQTGLDTLVVHAVNDDHWTLVLLCGISVVANALSDPPGNYGRKTKTQMELTGVRTSGGTCGLIRHYARNLT